VSGSQWRIDLARQISTFYDAEAIVVVGSPAFNLADAYSDLDLVMFWQEIPSDETRIEISKQFGQIHVVDSFNHEAEFSLQDAAEVIHIGENKLKLDITHKTIAAQTQMIEDVVTGLDDNRKKLAQIRNISRGVVLKGNDLLAEWRNHYEPMPEALKQKLLKTNLHFWAYHPLQKLVIERDDPLFARQLMSDSCEKIIVALCAMNGVYPPDKTKHLRYLLEGLEQPSETLDRIQKICNQPIMEAHTILNSLIEDIFDIADTFGYDTQKARTHYATERYANHEVITFSKEQ